MIDGGTHAHSVLDYSLPSLCHYFNKTLVFIWYHINKILVVSSNINLDNEQQLNSHSSPQYMNRWLSISKLASWHLFIVRFTLILTTSWHSLSHYHFNLSIHLMYEYWPVPVFIFTICTWPCVWTHSPVVSSTVYMPTLCSSTLHFQHLTVSFTYMYAVTHPFHNVIKMMVYALFFVRFHVLMWFSLCCQCWFGRHVQMRWWVRMQFRSSSMLMSR